MLKDSSGFLWIGTTDGLNRFNGYEFEIFRQSRQQNKGLSGNTVKCLLEDHLHRLWIGSENGITIFDPRLGTFAFLGDRNQKSNRFPHHNIQTMYADQNQKIWVGTESGLCQINPINLEIEFVLKPNSANFHLRNYFIYSILEDDCHGILIGTKQGLHRYDPQLQAIEYFIDPRQSAASSIRSLFKDSRNQIWVGTSSGVRIFDQQKKELLKQTPDANQILQSIEEDIRCIAEDHQKNIWLGTFAVGLIQYNPVSDQINYFQNNAKDPFSLSNNRIHCLYFDASRILWIGTWAKGINYIDWNRKPFKVLRPEISLANQSVTNEIYSVINDKAGYIWFGVWGHSLTRFHPGQQQFDYFTHQPQQPNSLMSNNIWAILEDQRQNLWISTDKGIDCLDPARKQFSHLPLSQFSQIGLYCLCEDHYGDIWIGTTNGLYRFNPLSKSLIPYHYNPTIPNTITNNIIWCIFEDSDLTLWIGTEAGGICRYNRSQDNFIAYRTHSANPKSIPSNSVLSVFEDHGKNLWFGTNSGLSQMIGRSDSFNNYSMEDGLPNNTIYAINEDHLENLWISTNKGLSRFNPHTFEFRNYTVTDGLADDEFTFACRKIGPSLYFGSINGITWFNPEEIKDNPNVPPVFIHSFSLFNQKVFPGISYNGRLILSKSIQFTDEIQLTHKDLILSFEYAALNFTSPANNQYAYKLEGFEKNWNYVANKREVSYSNLPPGSYCFMVKASNNDGIWNEKGAMIKIIVLPPFWKTWWFRTLLFIVIIFSSIGFHLYRVKILVQRERMKYNKSSITDSQIDTYMEQIITTIEQKKLYLDPDFNRSLIANELKIPEQYVSEVISKKTKMNLNDFINDYRCREVAEQLANPGNSHKSIIDISFEAGFNSKPTFNRVFKNKFGTTPSQYRENALKKHPLPTKSDELSKK
jgi:ligand-binding sensor domain-containing protein/AraC-like DNA-binding protein